MLNRVVTEDSHALGDSISTPLLVLWKRRNASWTMSSASPTLPTIRYAIENIIGLSSSYTWLLLLSPMESTFIFSQDKTEPCSVTRARNEAGPVTTAPASLSPRL